MSNLNDIFFTPAANQELTYDQVLEDVQRYFAENHASTIAEAGEGNAERATSLLKELMEHYIVKRKYALDGLSTKELCSKLYEDMAGYSFLKKWIYKPGVEEVNINAYNDIEVIESSGRSIKIPDKFSSPQHAIDVIRRMLNACGMVIDDTMPSIVGFLDKNIRISVDKTPIVDADVGVNASIRIVNQQTVSEEKLLNSGSATAEMLHFLTACIRYGVSVCIAGSTGSGKTTIMAWLLSNVPNNRRLITIEEGSREFDLVKRDAQGNILNSVVHLLTRPSENPALNINQDFLLERVLRKHPDVIGVGEMRSAAESLSAAESSRTGHTVCTTIHSNSCNSTLMESVLRVFGDYGLTVAPETIAAKQRNSSGPSEDLARLAGRRLANISEPSRGMRLNAAQVKSMTGNDSINARFLHCNSFDFRPQFKLYINTNYLPSVDDMSLFSSNRVRVIPFDRHFEPQEQDPNLKHLFAEEDAKSAILNWLIAGWRLLQKEGLNSPAAVVEATKEYSHDSNKIALFAEDNLEPDANREVRTSEIYAHYKVWCEVNGCLPENSTNFKKSLQAIGTVVRKRPRDGSEKTTLLLGYRLK